MKGGKKKAGSVARQRGREAGRQGGSCRSFAKKETILKRQKYFGFNCNYSDNIQRGYSSAQWGIQAPYPSLSLSLSLCLRV